MKERMAWYFLILVVILGMIAFGVRLGKAQDHHKYHNSYQNWASGVTSNCCSNQDCSDISEERVRESSAGTAIEINGQWCAVEKKHRIIKGQSPDWSKYHACIQLDHDRWSLPNGTVGKKAPCDRLLCFVTKGGGI